jgi:pimeloyl-ACP methyl ester carboxylesterase
MRSTARAVTRSQNMAMLLVVASGIAAATSVQGQAKPWGAGAGKGKTAGHYADMNGIKLYYEIRGTGRPLILLHGGLGAIATRRWQPPSFRSSTNRPRRGR